MKKYFFFQLLSAMLLLTTVANAQYPVTVSVTQNGKVQICQGNCQTGTVISLQNPNCEIDMPATVNVPHTSLAFPDGQLTVSFPNTGGNIIRLPRIPGLSLNNGTNGIVINYPSSTKPISLALNMMVQLIQNGDVRGLGATMDPLPVNLSMPKGGVISIKFDKINKKIIVEAREVDAKGRPASGAN